MKTPLKKHNPTISPPQKSKNDLPSILLINLYYGEHVIYGPRCYTAESKIRIPFFNLAGHPLILPVMLASMIYIMHPLALSVMLASMIYIMQGPTGRRSKSKTFYTNSCSAEAFSHTIKRDGETLLKEDNH